MLKTNPHELALALCARSTYKIRVGAVLSDPKGRIFAWGWNQVNLMETVHAEMHALSRANPTRVPGALLTVAAYRAKTGHRVLTRPCERICMPVLLTSHIHAVEYLSPNGWVLEKF